MVIDTHHHLLPDFFWRETDNSQTPVGGIAPLKWSKEASLSFMDDAGIDLAFLSVSTPGAHTGDNAKARSLARRCNEFGADLVRTRPDRFGLFACIPLPDIESSLAEITYAADELGSNGFIVFTNANGIYLGDPVLEPVFDELERRHAVVFVHPNPSPDPVAHSFGLPDNLLDFPTDTNRAVTEMHYTNRFARTPNVKYIFSHAGGSVPYLAARFAIIDEMGFIKGGAERGTAADMFRRQYWDTAAAASDPILRMLQDVAAIDHVLYGTDFPYMRRDLAVKSGEPIARSTVLSDMERRGVLGENAAHLLRRVAGATAS